MYGVVFCFCSDENQQHNINTQMVLSLFSHREIRNTRSLTTIDPEAFKDLPKLKYL